MNLHIDEKNRDNMIKAQHLEAVDKVPVELSDQLDFLHGWRDIDCRDYHFNAEIVLDAQIAFNKRFRGTGIIGPNFGTALEASAFGAEVIFKDDNPPWVMEALHNFDDLEAYVENLIEPDPKFSGYLPLFYQTYFYMNKLTDGQIDAPLGSISSFDVASLLVGLENLSIALKLTPDIAHKLLKKVNNFIINFIETRAEVFGVDKIELINLYGDNAGYISHDDFDEFVVPYNKEIFDYFGSEDSINLYHCDGRLNQAIDLIPKMNCNCLYSFDPNTDLKEFVDAIGNDVCLMGNLDPIRILRNGTPEQVEAECKRLIEIGKKAKGFVLTTGGEVANGTPPENLDALFRAIDKYGTY